MRGNNQSSNDSYSDSLARGEQQGSPGTNYNWGCLVQGQNLSQPSVHSKSPSSQSVLCPLLLHLEAPTLCPGTYPGSSTPREKQTNPPSYLDLELPSAQQLRSPVSDWAHRHVVQSLVCPFHYTVSLLKARTAFYP